MNFIAGLIALASAIAFAAIGIIVIVGIRHTLRTRVVPRFTIMQTPPRIRTASLIYIIVVAGLPTILTLLTAWQLIGLMLRAWS